MSRPGVQTSVHAHVQQRAPSSDAETDRVRVCVCACVCVWRVCTCERAWSRRNPSNWLVQFSLFSKKTDAVRGILVAQELIGSRGGATLPHVTDGEHRAAGRLVGVSHSGAGATVARAASKEDSV